MLKSNKRFLIIIVAFFIALALFTILTQRLLFGDVDQYVTSAKEFADISNAKIHNPHSFVYPLFLAQFLKIFPSLFTLKIINIIWLLLIAVTLFIYTKKLTPLLIFVFSPLVWYMSIWISPILPSSFFLLLAYLNFKRYNLDNSIHRLILSALFLGITPLLWDGMIFISLIFIIIFFFNKTVKEAFIYLIFFCIVFSTRFIVDYIYFDMPFYSLARFFGAWLFIIFGLNPLTKAYGGTYNNLEFLWIPIVIAPLLFLIYKLNFHENKQEILFLIFSFIAFSPMGEIRFLLILAPIVILLLSNVMKKREITINSIVSVIIIPFVMLFLFNLFPETVNDSAIKSDLIVMDKDFNESMVVGNNEVTNFATVLNSFYFGKNIPEFIWWEDYKLYKENKTVFYDISMESKPKIRDVRKLVLTGSLVKTDKADYNSVKYLAIRKKDKKQEPFINLVKCYDVLCVYSKK